MKRRIRCVDIHPCESRPQWTYEMPFESEAEAYASIAPTLKSFRQFLTKKALRAHVAPPLPKEFDGFMETRGPIRVLVAWIPDWVMSVNAGKFVCRLDTITQPR